MNCRLFFGHLGPFFICPSCDSPENLVVYLCKCVFLEGTYVLREKPINGSEAMFIYFPVHIQYAKLSPGDLNKKFLFSPEGTMAAWLNHPPASVLLGTNHEAKTGKRARSSIQVLDKAPEALCQTNSSFFSIGTSVTKIWNGTRTVRIKGCVTPFLLSIV